MIVALAHVEKLPANFVMFFISGKFEHGLPHISNFFICETLSRVHWTVNGKPTIFLIIEEENYIAYYHQRKPKI